jgi:hypothetical protein
MFSSMSSAITLILLNELILALLDPLVFNFVYLRFCHPGTLFEVADFSKAGSALSSARATY